MKAKFFVIVLFFSNCFLYGQITFEKGYIIDKENNRFECLIKNFEWRYNPEEIIFKHDSAGVEKKGDIASLIEFGIYNSARFIRANILIDRSSENINELTYERTPIWSKEILFLKVLVKGKATLYYYESGDLIRFFYSINDSVINQLVYKKYFIANSIIADNDRFRQQLWVDVNCSHMSRAIVENLKYNIKDMGKYFINYNKCMGDTLIETVSKTKKDFYNLKIASGLNISSISINNAMSDRNLNSKNNFSFCYGIESEFILPFNKNKWTVIIDPTFQYFRAKTETATTTIDFNSIEFPIGIRYYSYLNNKLNMFVNGFYISNHSINFDSKINLNNTVLDIAARNSFAIGVGMEYNRLSFELRYYTKRNILSDYMYWLSDYRRFSFILGFKIIKQRTNITMF